MSGEEMGQESNPEEEKMQESNPKEEKESDVETKKERPFRVEVLEKMSTLIAAAFGFVAAFAWNETFKTVLLGGIDISDKPLLLIGYAMFVTVLAVFMIIIVARATAKAKLRLEK